MIVGIGIPNGGTLTSEMASTIAMMAYHIGKNGDDVSLIFVDSCYIDRNRNDILERARRRGCDWLMYLDTDVEYIGEDDVISRMIGHGTDVVSGVYYGGVFPFRPVIFNFGENNTILQMNKEPISPEIWDAAGGGFLLISKKVIDAFTPEVIEKMGQPWDFVFQGKFGEPGYKLLYREDLAFCYRCKLLGFSVLCDPTMQLVHIKKQAVDSKHFESSVKYIDSIDAVPEGIPGWLTEIEISQLKQIASKSTDAIEIGSWKGRSTKVLLDSVKGNVYAVDNWKGTGSDMTLFPAQCQDIYSIFMQNVGHYPNLKVLRGDSLEIVKSFNGNRADMLFIDADHSYEGCKADIEAWLPKCQKYICGHDYSDAFPGVVKAVNEKFKNVNVTGSLWSVEL